VLTSLPVHLLVTEAPKKLPDSVGDFAAYREAAWLLRRHAVSILPSVSSLRALRMTGGKVSSPKIMVAFGDPVFGSETGGGDQRGVKTVTRSYTDFWRGAGIDRDKLSQALPRLADTSDELTAIAACSATVEAQQQYFSQTHDGDPVKQYAQRFGSDEGKQNGLYWAVPEGQPQSPLGPLGDFAKAIGYVKSGDKPQPFNGYFFQILTKQGDKAQGGAKDYIVNGKMTGGFAILAYPAEYRNSGIMTFIVGKDGIVYQKDLGENTTDAARAMAEYNPGDGWKPAI